MNWLKPTESGGRVLEGDTPWGRFRVEWDSAGVLIAESVEIKTPIDTQPTDSRGLGDSIAKVTDALRIPKCGGCKKRRDKLNKLMPYKRR